MIAPCVHTMLLYRNRGWLVLPLFLFAILGPSFLFPASSPTERAAHVGLLLASGGFVYWFGARSFRLASESLGRSLRPHEIVFDWGNVSPFDSVAFIHLRWWAIGFVAVAAILSAGFR